MLLDCSKTHLYSYSSQTWTKAVVKPHGFGLAPYLLLHSTLTVNICSWPLYIVRLFIASIASYFLTFIFWLRQKNISIFCRFQYVGRLQLWLSTHCPTSCREENQRINHTHNPRGKGRRNGCNKFKPSSKESSTKFLMSSTKIKCKKFSCKIQNKLDQDWSIRKINQINKN